MIGLNTYLIISAILFTLGAYCVISRRNAIAILMGVELILNSANINFVAFSYYSGKLIDGQLFAIFVIVLAAAEAVVALAIFIAIYLQFRTINADEVNILKE